MREKGGRKTNVDIIICYFTLPAMPKITSKMDDYYKNSRGMKQQIKFSELLIDPNYKYLPFILDQVSYLFLYYTYICTVVFYTKVEIHNHYHYYSDAALVKHCSPFEML